MKKRNLNTSRITTITFLIIGLLLLPTMLQAVSVRWNSVPESDLAGYKIYYGTQSCEYKTVIDVGNMNEYGICDLEPGQTYYFVITSYDNWGNESGCSTEMIFTKKECTTSLLDNAQAPQGFHLVQNYPNPFNPGTTIQFSLDEGAFSVKVYNMRGERVKVLADGTGSAGTQSVEWDGTDEYGSTVASGVYLCCLQQGRQTATRRMILAR